MNEPIKQTLADLKARQEHGERMSCPRCGQDIMNPDARRNVVSRHADVFVCDDCGMAEAMLECMNNPLPLSRWHCFREESLHHDFKALTADAAAERLRKEQVPCLVGLYERWIREQADDDFEAYRREAHRRFPGLTELWNSPFQAAYDVADGRLLIRFRTGERGTEIAIDLIPKR
jgi:predicted RNA-binding Zn-ribbon protein involved in translation (DUF1610 family)